MWIAGLALLLAADPQLERILAVVDARDHALRAFAARYYETEVGERIGPRFFAWSPERSLYRGPKRSRPFAVQGWFTGESVRCESLYFKDRRQVVWLHRELEPVKMVWQGTRTRGKGPWIAEESGLFWRGRLLGEVLRKEPVRILGREPMDGHPCVKLIVECEFPDLLWLAEDCGYFPCRAIEHRIGGWGASAQPDRIRVGECNYSPTDETRWEELRRAGPIWYPLRVRITGIDRDERLIEAVPGGVRFNDDVTAEDFTLPGLYFLDDSLTSGYAAVTPLGRIPLEGAGVVLLLLGGLVVWRRRRRRR